MISYPSSISPLPYYDLPEQRDLISRVRSAKEDGRKIVIASGVFDLLHEAHIQYLENAKKAGDLLVVLVESDERTRELKGKGRPVWPQEVRAQKIKDLNFVDEVMILPPEFKTPERYEEIVLLLEPDIYAASSHSDFLDAKQELMHKYGGEVRVVLQKKSGISTTIKLKQKA